MVRKISYSDCKTKGMGTCWYCDSKTNYVLDDETNELFCCFACAVLHYKSSKLRRKVKNLEKTKRSESRGNLHIKNEQKSKIKGELSPLTQGDASNPLGGKHG